MSGDSPTWTTCNSEPVLLARSAAVVAANLPSLEPSVARRTLVGNILTGLTSLLYAPSLGVMMPQAEVQRLRPESIHPSAWKENTRKSRCKILHRSGSNGQRITILP